MSGVLNRLYHGETRIDFMGRRKIWFTISGVVMIICIASLIGRGLNYGIEFEGGVSIQAPIADDGPLAEASDLDVISEIRDVLGRFDATDAQVQVSTTESGREVVVQTKEISDPTEQDNVVNAVAEATGSDLGDLASQRVGSKWGGEITKKAIRALVIFLFVVLAFISFRFEFKMAVSAIIALIHDLVITAGIYSLVGFEVTPSTVIAILTILGYSLYDTVVVFDKVEENTQQLAATGRMTYQDSANLAMNQVFMRSLNTSLATLLPVAALLFVGAGLLGATTLEDLALALFVGILTGTYSSIFVATPILATWKETEPRYRNIREKIMRDVRKSALQPATATAGAGAPDRASEATPAVSSTPTSGGGATRRPQTKPRAGSKKAKRRKRR